MERYREVMVALSESRREKSREEPPGVGLTMTPCPVRNKHSYLGNQSSQIKSYYGSLA